VDKDAPNISKVIPKEEKITISKKKKKTTKVGDLEKKRDKKKQQQKSTNAKTEPRGTTQPHRRQEQKHIWPEESSVSGQPTRNNAGVPRPIVFPSRLLSCSLIAPLPYP